MLKKTKINNGIESSFHNAPFPVAHYQQTANIFTVYLFGSIDTPVDFIEAIEALTRAEKGDTVILRVSGPGGCISSVDALLHAIQSAIINGVNVHAICTGLVASAMTFIPLTASSYELSEGFHALIHNGSMGDGGAFNQFKASSTFYIRYMEDRLREMYKHFLTSEELDNVLEGKDIWLDPCEWAERYERRNEYILAEHEELCSMDDDCEYLNEHIEEEE